MGVTNTDGVTAAPAPTDAQILELARQQGDEAEHGFIFNKDGRWSVLTFARALLAHGVSAAQDQTFPPSATDGGA